MRIDLSGNGASIENISLLTSAPKGTIINAHRRVIKALTLMAEDEIKWPFGKQELPKWNDRYI